MKMKEALESYNSNEGAFTSKLISPENYQQLSRGSVQQPHNDDNEEQNQRISEQLNGGKRTKQSTQHGAQISYPF